MSATIESLRRPKRKSELDSRETRESVTTKHRLPGVGESEDQLREERIVKVDEATMPKNFDLFAFLEEPVKILVHRSHEKNFAPKCTDYIAINGVPVDILTPKGWVKVGYLPRGQAVTIRRKYVEVLAKAHQETFQTNVVRPVGEDPINELSSTKSYTLPFSVMYDANPRGAEWLEGLLAQQV